jgi:chromosome partitioning protein
MLKEDAANLAIGLSRYHSKRVLLVDLDPQFNATQYLVNPQDYLRYINTSNNCTIQDIFLDRIYESVGTGGSIVHKGKVVEPSASNCMIRICGEKNTGFLDLIPSKLDLMEADIQAGRGIENRLRNFLRKIKSKYDIVLLDCPPTMGLFAISAYLTSEAYLTPVSG